MDDVPYEQRLLSRAITYRAKTTPNNLVALLPNGDALEDGFFGLTYRQLDSAVDSVAYWLDGALSDGKKLDFENDSQRPTIAYAGPNDYRYVLLLYALPKTNRRLMITLPTNTKDGLVKLLNAENVKTVLASGDHIDTMRDAADSIPGGQLIEMPPLSSFLNTEPHTAYPFDSTPTQSRNDIWMVMQSSGTTGDPKPLPQTNRFAEAYLEQITATENGPPDQQIAYVSLLRGCYVPLLWPLSWGTGLLAASLSCVASDSVAILLPATMPSPMTTQYAKEVMRLAPRGPKNSIMMVPGTIQELAKEPTALEGFKNYDWIGYAGAPLDHKAGDLVSKYTRVQCLIGSTESGMYPLLLNDPKDWKYNRFHRTLHGFHLVPFLDGLHEICIKRAENDEWRPAFTLDKDPNLAVFHTKDVCRLVPGREGFWEICGRTDDFVKLSSLTKFNGINIEQIIDRHPDVKKCLVAGDGKVKPFALIQPSSELEALHLPAEEVVDRIWPAIEAANKTLIEEAKLLRELVLVTSEDMPIGRLAKGTINRRATLAMYADGIEEMYRRSGLDYAAPHTDGYANGQVHEKIV